MKNMKQFYVFNIICTIVTCKKKMTLTNKKNAKICEQPNMNRRFKVSTRPSVTGQFKE